MFVTDMQAAASEVVCGHVTYATSDAKVQGRELHEGDRLAFAGEDLIASGTSLAEVTLQLVEHLVREAGEDAELITLYQGAEASEADTASIVETMEPTGSLEVEHVKGGQPVYDFLVSVE